VLSASKQRRLSHICQVLCQLLCVANEALDFVPLEWTVTSVSLWLHANTFGVQMKSLQHYIPLHKLGVCMWREVGVRDHVITMLQKYRQAVLVLTFHWFLKYKCHVNEYEAKRASHENYVSKYCFMVLQPADGTVCCMLAKLNPCLHCLNKLYKQITFIHIQEQKKILLHPYQSVAKMECDHCIFILLMNVAITWFCFRTCGLYVL
jgi:hypothetical protein